jgi:hypothetical protein
MKDTQIKEVTLGAILPGPFQFLKTISVSSEDDRFSIELPGQITRCAGQSAFAIKPWGRINFSEGECRRTAIVTAGVEDEHGLDGALAPFRDRMAARAPNGFALRLASRRSFGEAFDALEKAGHGCGCGPQGGGAQLPGMLAVGLGWDTGEEVWSKPVAARLFLDWSYGPEDGVYLNNCHSMWTGFFDRRTDCEGDCGTGSTKRCMCQDDKGNWRFWYSGWRTCWCVNP